MGDVNGKGLASWIEYLPGGNLINWGLGNKNGIQALGDITQDVGTVAQFFSKNGYKVKNVGQLTEILGDGFQRSDIDDLGGVAGDWAGNYLGQKLFGDGFFGRIGGMIMGYALNRLAQNMLHQFAEMDPNTSLDSPEVKAAEQAALNKTKDQMTAIGVTGGVASVAAVGADRLLSAGVDKESGMVTATSAQYFKDQGLLAEPDKKQREQYIKDHYKEFANTTGQGQYVSVDEQRRMAGETFDKEFGGKLKTEGQYYLDNRKVLPVMGGNMGGSWVVNDSEVKEEKSFLQAEYNFKTQVAAANAERAKNGLPIMTKEEALEQLSPPRAEFNERFDDKAVSSNMPLTEDAVKVLGTDRAGLATPMDMKKYHDQWISKRIESLQSRIGEGEFLSREQRRSMAETEYQQKHPNGVALYRVKTPEEYAQDNATVVKDTRHAGMGVYAVVNQADVNGEQEFLKQKYSNDLKEAQQILQSGAAKEVSSNQPLAVNEKQSGMQQPQPSQPGIKLSPNSQQIANDAIKNLKQIDVRGLVTVDGGLAGLTGPTPAGMPPVNKELAAPVPQGM